MAKALGFGFAEPIFQPASPNGTGVDPNYTIRHYDPEKARQLLAEAGYPDGFKTTMSLQTTNQDTGVIIKAFLAKVGIDVRLDPADPGRFWGKQFKDGWDGLHLSFLAINGAFAVGFVDHFGPEALVGFASMRKSPEFLARCRDVLGTTDMESMDRLTVPMVRQASDDVMVIPTYTNNRIVVTAKNVHTTILTQYDQDAWNAWEDWKENN